MRVLHVIADLGTYGAERLLALLLNNLRDGDLQLAVMTVYSSPEGAASLTVPVFDVARRGRYDLAFFPRMVGTMRRWKPDIVHTHMHNGKYWGRFAALAAGVPTIVHTEHNSEFGAPGVFRLANRVLVPRTDAVIAFSPVHRDALAGDEGIPLERIAVIPNGIELARLPADARARARAAMGASETERLLVHVGRLSPVKNQRLAMETLRLLPGQVRLVFVGDGPDRAALEAAAAELGVADRTTFLGFRDDAALLVAGADVALVTSRNEAMPLAVIEAMVAGAPLVSTPWAGAAAMLGAGRYGLLARAATPDALADAVREVFDRPGEAAARAADAAEHAAAEFDIATQAARYAALYRELSARTRSANVLMTAERS
jgi:glycosyltransferase involved in cell wall biosynthesis